MPVVDRLSTEYGDRVAFVAPAWRGTFERTAEVAGELLTSGNVMWGLDEREEVFAAYGIPGQPVTVVIDADKRIVAAWAGSRPEPEVRSLLDELVASG